jgi:hypothetical protein
MAYKTYRMTDVIVVMLLATAPIWPTGARAESGVSADAIVFG